MKKLFPLFLMSLLTFSAHSQSLVGKIHSTNLYFIDIDDTSASYLTSSRIIGNNFEFYSAHYTYALANENQVTLNIYRDSVMLYEETDKANNILFSGTLRLDTNELHIVPSSELMANEIGEIIEAIDTSYIWLKDGIWKEPVEDGISQVKTYKMGRLTEEKAEIWINCQKPILISVPKDNYTLSADSMLYSFNLPNHKDLENLIIGEWFHPKCEIFKAKPLMVYTKAKPNTSTRFGTIQTTFKPKNKYEAQRRFRCGTGLNPEDYNPKGKWEITKSGELKIETYVYEIIYIDENILILR